jgi:DNA-binding transcriptional regulator GbsR (MarR family)
MKDRDPAAVERFIERFTQTLVDAGMPRIASRIFATLLAADDGRLTAGELSDQVQASPAAISGGVRYLAHVGMVRRSRAAGSRRDTYSVDDDVWYRVISDRDQLLARWTANLRDGAEALGEQTPAGARLLDSVEFFEFLSKELDEMVARWEEHRRTSR